MATQKTAPAQFVSAASTATTPATASARKSWVKKTPVEVVLEQIGKQEQKVAGMRAEFTREERELAKLNKAKSVLEEK